MSQGIPSDRQIVPDHGWLSRERALALVLVVTTAIVIYLCYRLAVPFLPALAWALALAVIVHPLHRWINRWMPGQTPAAVLSVVLVAVVIIVPVSFVTHHLIQQADNAVKLIQEQLKSGEWHARLEKHPRLKPIAVWVQSQIGLPTPEPAADSDTEPSDAKPSDTKPSDAQATKPADPAKPPPEKASLEGAANMVAQSVGSVLTSCAWIGMQLFITL
ncbi:MAG: AI-2E family transporter, partial [Planctomycetaceae bacterium]|nr:AI-2E family transporter [Planctomycetaceae bacterium]